MNSLRLTLSRLTLSPALAPAHTRSNRTIHTAQFSPTHSSSTNITWLKPLFASINIYDPIYTCDAKNLTIFDDQKSPNTPMLVECVDEGFISHIFHTSPTAETEPNEVIGILSVDEKEHRRITATIAILTPADQQSHPKVFKALGEGPENTFMWEGFLKNAPEKPSHEIVVPEFMKKPLPKEGIVFDGEKHGERFFKKSK